MTYSNGDILIALQEVLSKNLQFHNGTYSELPDSIKFILDNLQFAFTKNHCNVFQKTLRALEIHLVNLVAQNEVYMSHYGNLIPENDLASHIDFVPENNLVSKNEVLVSRLKAYTSQLFGKDEIHSMDKESIMGTDYARLSLKTQSMLRSVVANLPSDLQSRILDSKPMFRSFDLWSKYFRKLITATIPNPNELEEGDNVFIQLEWEDHFGSSLRVYEKKHPFPGLLIDFDDGSYFTDEFR